MIGLKSQNFYASEEKKMINKVFKRRIFSDFLGNYHPKFYGGKFVRDFENKLSKYYNMKYAITFNSWTSGLIAAVGALDINPGDEVIVPTWTMTACPTSILFWGAKPVFADISMDDFNIDPKSIEKRITAKTKAIMVVDIHGSPANYKEIIKIKKKYNLKLIVDAAQAPGSKFDKKFTVNYSDIGGYSFNKHKHIQTGEGGVCLTNNKDIAMKAMLIRNHGEGVLDDPKRFKKMPMIGFNFRMTEMEAAMGIAQLPKLKKIVNEKYKIANLLTKGLKKIKYIRTLEEKKNCAYSYYMYPLILDCKKIGMKRNLIVNDLKKLKIQCRGGFYNLHKLPLYKYPNFFLSKKYPLSFKKKTVQQKCPVAEKLHNETFLSFQLCSFNYTKKDVKKIIAGFKKLWEKYKLKK